MWLNNQLELKLRLHHGYDNNYKRENRMRNGEEDLANSMERDSRTNNEIFMLSGVWNVGTWSFRPEMELDWQHEKTDYLRGKLDTVATRNNLLPAPSFNLQWKPNKKNTLRASVNYKAKLPDIISTLNYHDDTNPLSIIEGNTNLKRSGSLSADINYVLSNPKYEQMFSLTMKYGSEYDPVSSVSYYNTATGVYRTHQENTRGGNSLSLNIGYDRALSDRWELQNMLELSTGDTYGILTIIEGSVQRTITQQRLTEIQYRPTLKYQYNNWKFTVAGKGIMRHNKYDNGQVDAFTLYYYNLKTNAEYTIGNFTFQLSPWFEGRKGYNTPRFNRDNLILDAAAWYKFGKNKWTARLDLNDIFNRALNNYANETGTSRYETQSRFMHHFIKFSLEYRFDAKGKKK